MRRLTREWVVKAEADFVAAGALEHTQPPVHDARCFHCQQCAEKYLESLLEEAALSVVPFQTALDVVCQFSEQRGLPLPTIVKWEEV